MTSYTREDLADQWEFKILRSATGQFKHPQKLRQFLDEERRAGWIMVEKFDDHRIRLKRHPADPQNDLALGFDPHRTYVGVSQGKLAVMILVGIFGSMALIGALIAVVTVVSQ